MTRIPAITYGEGNLLEADVDALVNAVNTVGVMGRGIALQFKEAYPAMFRDYARAAQNGEIALGRMHVWQTGLTVGPRIIVNFPTKGHWRSRSRLENIRRGLDALVEVVAEQGIGSIAIPPLGCGLGGLDWADVQALIRDKLVGVVTLDVILFPPRCSAAT